MNRRRWSAGLSVLWAVFCVSACGSDSGTAPGPSGGSAGGGDAPDGGGAREPNLGTVTIDIRDRTFLPPGSVDGTVSIGLGQKIRWVNLDATPHMLTSVSVPDGGKPFSAPLASRSEGGEFVFEPRTTGVWEYVCELHPYLMSNGRIVVR